MSKNHQITREAPLKLFTLVTRTRIVINITHPQTAILATRHSPESFPPRAGPKIKQIEELHTKTKQTPILIEEMEMEMEIILNYHTDLQLKMSLSKLIDK